jgi:hypothetical protein
MNWPSYVTYDYTLTNKGVDDFFIAENVTIKKHKDELQKNGFSKDLCVVI